MLSSLRLPSLLWAYYCHCVFYFCTMSTDLTTLPCHCESCTFGWHIETIALSSSVLQKLQDLNVPPSLLLTTPPLTIHFHSNHLPLSSAPSPLRCYCLRYSHHRLTTPITVTITTITLTLLPPTHFHSYLPPPPSQLKCLPSPPAPNHPCYCHLPPFNCHIITTLRSSRNLHTFSHCIYSFFPTEGHSYLTGEA